MNGEGKENSNNCVSSGTGFTNPHTATGLRPDGMLLMFKVSRRDLIIKSGAQPYFKKLSVYFKPFPTLIIKITVNRN